MKINHERRDMHPLLETTLRHKYELVTFDRGQTVSLPEQVITFEAVANLGVTVLKHLQSIPTRVTTYVQDLKQAKPDENWSNDKISSLMLNELIAEINQGLADNNRVYQLVLYPFLMQQLHALQVNAHVGTAAYLATYDDALSHIDFDSPVDINVDLASRFNMENDHQNRFGFEVWYQCVNQRVTLLDVITTTKLINQYFGLTSLSSLSHFPLPHLDERR